VQALDRIRIEFDAVRAPTGQVLAGA